uniref:DM10 domain-containing protein n=1 Tax=Echeneis naucrates TaxID=173247 RepID=A0A665UA69_ECHNA
MTHITVFFQRCFLPYVSQLGRERFHKSQHFDYSNGVPMMVGSEKPGIGGDVLVGQKIKPIHSVYPKGQGSDLPSWVAFDKQALCFEAYFQEAVPEAQDEKHRIRKCNIYFFLEDDTVQVVEPAYKNSGIPQGTLIRRHRIPLPPPDDDQFYNVFHFNINQQMVLYSRTFTVTNCDCFTKNFLTRLGVHVNDPTTAPEDPYTNLRQQKNMNPFRPYEKRDTLKQFLELDCKVLRFYCLWDNTESTIREPRQLILHYYLADDTIEILEVVPPNSGRDRVPKFLRRSKLPKVKQCIVLFRAVQEEFYKDCDLIVGGEVNVLGRRVILADCDNFTKDYYRSKYGIEDFTPVHYKAPVAPKPRRFVPPYNGFGSEEDSLSSCLSLQPKPPYTLKYLCLNVLIFRAKMVTANPVDRARVFIISFYLSDDSISVFERPQRNSGVIGGKFLERGRVKKPGQAVFKSEPSEYFKAQDLYVGATLCLNNKNFQLLHADEYTLSYMEKHDEEVGKDTKEGCSFPMVGFSITSLFSMVISIAG